MTKYNAYNYQAHQATIARAKRHERYWWTAALFLLAVLILFCMVGCGGSAPENEPEKPEMDACNTNVPGIGPCIVRTAPKQ